MFRLGAVSQSSKERHCVGDIRDKHKTYNPRPTTVLPRGSGLQDERQYADHYCQDCFECLSQKILVGRSKL
jgi:hypothetical protein